MKRFFTLIFISQDGKHKKQFDVNVYLFRAIIVFFILLIAGIVFMAVYLGNIYSDAMQKNVYEKRVIELEGEMAKINEIKKDIRYLYEREEKLKELLGIDIQHRIIESHEENINEIIIDSMVSIESVKKQSTAYPDMWPVKGIVSREFSSQHPAIDIAAVEGSPVVSPVKGRVSSVGWDKVFGNYVRIKADNSIIFLGHLSKVFVDYQQTVKKGEIVGLVGNTGESTAPHLHYEIMMNSMFVNPRKFLP
ncbi:MAG: M23 family metallopeptidase [bacterium]